MNIYLLLQIVGKSKHQLPPGEIENLLTNEDDVPITTENNIYINIEP